MNVWMAIDKKSYSQKPQNHYEFNEIRERTRENWKSVDLAVAAIIITNLRHINGGEKKFLKTLEKYYDEETLEKWKTALKYMCGYKPMRCEQAEIRMGNYLQN